jgi:hypothetical protein
LEKEKHIWVARIMPQEIRPTTALATLSITHNPITQPANEVLQTLTIVIEINLTTVSLFLVMVQSNHAIPAYILFVPLARPIRMNISSWKRFTVLEKTHETLGLMEVPQPSLTDENFTFHNPQESDAPHLADKENNPNPINRNAQRHLSAPPRGRRPARPNIPCSPSRRSTRLQMKRAQQGRPHATNKKCGGRFHGKPALSFDPNTSNEALDVAQVYALLDIIRVDFRRH